MLAPAVIALPVAIAPSQAERACAPGQDDWSDLPAYVVSDLDDGEGSWLATDERKWPAEKLRVERKLVEPLVLEVHVTSSTGCSAEFLQVRLACSAEGRLSAKARSTWSTHIGGVASVLHRDLHGPVLLAPGSPGEREPPRLAFRVHGIENWGCGPHPVVVSGCVELSELPWPTLAPAPLPEHATEDLDHGPLEEVTSTWPDGTIRARGRLDTDGRRHGLWTTWHPNGAKESEAHFRHGERDGPWASFLAKERPFQVGTLRNGLEEGPWTERVGDSVASGNYVEGRKSGEWETHEHGRLIRRETYENGILSGPQTSWWPNGNKRSEGRWRNGWPEGQSLYWNEDGSLKETSGGSRPKGRCVRLDGSRRTPLTLPVRR